MRSKIKDILFKTATSVVSLLACGILARLGIVNYNVRSPYCYEPCEDGYGLAANSISKSDMWSHDKTAALQALSSDAPDWYYKSIIAIAGGDMWSHDKLNAIKEESAKFGRNRW